MHDDSRPGLAALARSADSLMVMDDGEPGAAPDYRRGDRVALVRTEDPDTRLRPGDEGTVTGWNPRQGQLFVNWDSGSSLTMLPDEGDQVRVIERAPGQHAENAASAGDLAGVLRGHLGDLMLTRRAVAGFVDCQGVRLVDVVVTAGQAVMVVVEGQQPVLGDLPSPVQKTVPAADLVIPREWILGERMAESGMTDDKRRGLAYARFMATVAVTWEWASLPPEAMPDIREATILTALGSPEPYLRQVVARYVRGQPAAAMITDCLRVVRFVNPATADISEAAATRRPAGSA
jgi:Domain of unknown function (DUF4314)